MVNAVLEGNEKYIAANKQHVDAVSEDGYTPLYAACMRGAPTSIVQLLLKLGAKVDLKGSDRETPLYIAVFNNHADHVKLLLAASANVNEENGTENETALHAAAKFGYVDLLLLLLKNGANINARTSRMETPLFSAAKNGKHDACYHLLINNANPNLGNDDGKNPLYIASEKRLKHCVIVLKSELKYLKEAKAEADTELKLRRPSMPSTEEIEQRLMRTKSQEAAAAAEALKAETAAAAAKKSASPQPARGAAAGVSAKKAPAAPPVEKMEIIPIEIPKQVIRDHDPITGQKYGPCRTLEEVGYDTPPTIPAGVVLKPVEHARIGGTSMMVGTGTDETPVAPKTISMLPDDDTVDYGVILPKQRK